MDIREGFSFLIGDIKIHPTTGVRLEYLKRKDAICVAVFDNDLKNVYMVEQYRPGSDSKLIEIVAGIIDDGEDPLHAMYRELAEETGFDKDSIEELYSMEKPQFVSAGYTTEKLYYYAVKLKKGAVAKEQKLDEGEDLDVIKMPYDLALESSRDTKSTLALLHFMKVMK